MTVLHERQKTEALYSYVPDDAEGHNQLAYHKSDKMIRIGLGGTGSGKTVVTCMEVGAALTGEQMPWIGVPYRKPPLHAWFISHEKPENIETHSIVRKLTKGDLYTDPETGEQVSHPAIIPARLWDRFDRKSHVGYLTNGSTFQIKSIYQELTAFSSAGIDIIVFDEPCPEDIWQEVLLRTVRRAGARILMALTPTGMAMDYLDEYAQGGVADADVFYFDTTKNKYLSKRELETVISLIPPDMRATRLEGRLGHMSGLVYAEWDNWVAPFEIPEQWTRYVIHDPGVNNPAATLWFAVSPANDIYAYKSLYDKESKSVISKTVEKIKAMNGAEEIYRWYIDPFAASVHPSTPFDPRKGSIPTVRAIYKECGIDFTMGPTEQDKAGRLQRILAAKQYINKECKSRPNIFAFDSDDMAQLRRELRLYRWMRNEGKATQKNEQDQPHPKHDHLMYCLETACALGIKYVEPGSRRVGTLTLPGIREYLKNSAESLWNNWG